ncbi:MAG TPA: ATP-binding protein [Chloroflexi bacterium]|nr:ATP-binding protein [Chloroflexota bacterium]
MTLTTPGAPIDFSGAQRTAELVGRDEEMRRITALLATARNLPRVIAITADGGIGKTRLLQEALAQAHAQGSLDVAGGLVDLYHAPTHTENGLADAIHHVLGSSEKRFANYGEERRKLQRLRLTGEVAGVEAQRQRALKAFDDDMTSLAKARPLVLALDTAECLVYDRALRPTNPRQIAQAFTWLCTRLTVWRNVIVLFAGRPAALPLLDQMERIYRLNIERVTLPPLSEDACVHYFTAVEAMTRAAGDVTRADLIARLPEDDRRRAGRLAEGRPVLLGWLTDLITAASVTTIRGLLDQVEANTQAETPGAVRQQLEAALIGRLKEAPGRIGDTIEMLGRARKGVDLELAHKLLGLSEQHEREAFLRLDAVKGMSIVKVHPDDARVFLHDEVYDILERALYQTPEDEVAAGSARENIFKHYQARIDAMSGRLAKFWEPVEMEGVGRIDLEELTRLTGERADLMAEMLYYRFRQAPDRGLLRYYRYMHEAIHSGDVLFDMQLQAELMAFLGEQEDKIEEVDRRLAHGLLAIHPVLRLWANQDYHATTTAAAQIRMVEAETLDNAAPHAAAIMDAWLAYALVYQGSESAMSAAEQSLRQTLARLAAWEQQPQPSDLPHTDVTKWLSKAMRAFALRVLGYLEWGRGRMGTAIELSGQAAQLWRALNLAVERATTLNDMGFAMSEEGLYADARALVEDALDIRRGLGPRSPVALSLNTLALIEIHEGNYHKATDLANRALAIFRALGDERGTGLALIALSEATRRSIDDLPEHQYEGRVALLRKARDHAREAADIFQSLGEKIRQAEALLEVGCACRDWVEQLVKRQSLADSRDALIAESEKALWQAYETAAGVFPRYQLDAMVDLAWLGLYAEREEIRSKAESTAEALIGEDYRLRAGRPKPVIVDQDAEQKVLWPEIGKLYAQRGHQLFRRYMKDDEKNRDQELLRQSAENYWLGLQYSIFYTEDYHNLRREKDRIYRALKRLTENELQVVRATILAMESRYGYTNDNKSDFRTFLENRALWS